MAKPPDDELPPDASAHTQSADPPDPDRKADADVLQVGQQVGNYKLVRKLGEGGVGVVFEAQHLVLSRRAAIKVLRPEFSRNPDMVGRFFREAESSNLVGHPGIVSIFEFLRLPDQTVCIVMEYLE